MDRGWGWRGQAVMAMSARQSVQALLAVQAKQAGMWFDSGPSPIETFAEPVVGCSEDPSPQPSPPGKTFAQSWGGCPEDPHPNPLPLGEGARAVPLARARGVLQRSPRRGIKSGRNTRARGVVQWSLGTGGDGYNRGRIKGAAPVRAAGTDEIGSAGEPIQQRGAHVREQVQSRTGTGSRGNR